MKRLCLLASVTLSIQLAPAIAEACGGMFCDGGGPQGTMPVDQAAEDILFVIDGETVETHVRIRYEGEAEAFAWIVPIMGTPQFAIGSEPLFTLLGTSTTPNYQVATNNTCAPSETSATSGSTTGSGFVSADSAVGPDVILQEQVGAFEAVVLAGGTGASVLQWLGDNGYQQDPAAEPILDEYLAEGHTLAAFKISADATTDSIHPLIIRHLGTEPCVPIRLTRIAAVDDMGIRVYGLNNEQLYSTNYSNVVLNHLHLDRFDASSGYDDLVSMAVDEADGHGFVVEYAGDSNIVPSWQLWSDAWDSTAYLGLGPADALWRLVYEDVLIGHPLVQAMVRRSIPTPAGVEEQWFWEDPYSYEAMIDTSAWDAVAFADELETTVLEPAFAAATLVQTWPYLTRMYTTMSPQEMTVDPFFGFRDGLPDVQRIRNASTTVGCVGEPNEWVVDGYEFCENDMGQWPPELDPTPWAARIERIPMVGAPLVEIDNTEVIQTAVWKAEQAHCGGGGETGEGTTTAGDGGLGEGGTGMLDDLDGLGSRGCGGGCDAAGGGSAPFGWLGLLVPLGLVRRRRTTIDRPSFPALSMAETRRRNSIGRVRSSGRSIQTQVGDGAPSDGTRQGRK